MRKIDYTKDRTLNRVTKILEEQSEELGVEILSVVLYGSRAKGDFTSQSDYEILVITSNEVELPKFIQFNERLKFELLRDKLINVKILTYTREIFEEILYNDNLVGTFLFMICRENITIFDKRSTFITIRERLTKNSIKSEETFLEQCVEFAKNFGSEKWERKWDRALMQVKYHKRRSIY